jgi:hypothetical protein
VAIGMSRVTLDLLYLGKVEGDMCDMEICPKCGHGLVKTCVEDLITWRCPKCYCSTEFCKRCDKEAEWKINENSDRRRGVYCKNCDYWLCLVLTPPHLQSEYKIDNNICSCGNEFELTFQKGDFGWYCKNCDSWYKKYHPY